MPKLKMPKHPPFKGTPSQPPTPSKATLPEIKETNPDLWYKLKVLLYDLSNIKTDPASVTRLERTVHELYLSSPYFTSDEAEAIKNALVPKYHHDTEEESDENGENTEMRDETITSDDEAQPEPLNTRILSKENDADSEQEETVQEAIQRRMATFYDKRKASGDFRPCGPHDMVPVYLQVFGIEKGELGDERFLGRVRRIGIGIENGKESGSSGNVKVKDGGKGEVKIEKGKGKGKKGK